MQTNYHREMMEAEVGRKNIEILYGEQINVLMGKEKEKIKQVIVI